MIDRFHEEEDIFVFLISTLAGGTGLNLTGANKVVIFDPNWSKFLDIRDDLLILMIVLDPAHDLQAMDRYRTSSCFNPAVLSPSTGLFDTVNGAMFTFTAC